MNKFYLVIALLSTSVAAENIDTRQILLLTNEQRHQSLTEMRAMLAGTQKIMSALAKDDMVAVAEHAKLFGHDMEHKVENHLHDVLPEAFMKMGMAVHKDFDLIAADALSLKDPQHTLQQLSQAMNKCIACHAIYQIQTVGSASEARLDEVAHKGAHVMPFDLDKTTHVFSKTKQGGVQKVITKDSTDNEQITLIRQHLSKISKAFAQGDFSDPHRVHGDNMPGLTELESAKKDQIKIEYKDLPDGSQIIYSTEHVHLVEAIHQWFDAQLNDHARHAVSGNTHEHGHH